MSATAQVIENIVENSELSAADVAAFLDGQLEGDELKRVQAYLAEHAEGRQELIKASRIMSDAPAQKRSRTNTRWLIPAVGLATAAALLLMVQPRTATTPGVVSRDRQSDLEASDAIALVSPAAGARLRSDQGTFTWRAYDGARYDFILSDEAGHPLYQRSTSDTSLTIDAAALSPLHGKLYWRVEAHAENGSSLASGLTGFELLPR